MSLRYKNGKNLANGSFYSIELSNITYQPNLNYLLAKQVIVYS
jgi:hypothetical protein